MIQGWSTAVGIPLLPELPVMHPDCFFKTDYWRESQTIDIETIGGKGRQSHLSHDRRTCFICSSLILAPALKRAARLAP
jgi:hypothetical protein